MERGTRAKFFFLGPAVIVTLAASLYPMYFAIVTSFRNWQLAKSLTPQEFIGLDNYTRALEDERFLNSLIITIEYIVISVSMSIVLGLFMALLLQPKFWLNTIVKTLMILPFAVSPALRGFTWKFMLNPQYGAFDKIVDTTLPFMADIQWLADPVWALIMLAITEVWGWSPLVALMFIGGLDTINPEVTEAASLDGANEWQIFWRITLPLLSPIILLVTLLRIIFSLKIFDQIVTMTGGGPGDATQALNYFVYLNGFRFFDLGYASALGYILLLMMFLAAFFYVRALLGGTQ
ncbi:MAG: sugar ABC transporter permease [Chloroflexota bacterium]